MDLKFNYELTPDGKLKMSISTPITISWEIPDARVWVKDLAKKLRMWAI